MPGAAEETHKGLGRRLARTLIDVNLEKRESVFFEMGVFK
jgi:hypothetical protein